MKRIATYMLIFVIILSSCSDTENKEKNSEPEIKNYEVQISNSENEYETKIEEKDQIISEYEAQILEYEETISDYESQIEDLEVMVDEQDTEIQGLYIDIEQYEKITGNKGGFVYVTKTGTKYHHQRCNYLRDPVFYMLRQDAIDSGYTPSSQCCINGFN